MENNKTFARVEDSPNGNPRFVKTTQKDHGFLGGFYQDVRLEEISPNRIMLHTPMGQYHRAGDTLVMTFATREYPGIFVCDSADVLLSDIHLYHTAAMGVIAQTTQNITLEQVIAKPRIGSGRFLCTNADATHFVNCRGFVKHIGCTYEQMMDDAANVHGIYHLYQGQESDGTLQLGFGHYQQKGVQPYRTGDRVAVIDSTTNQIRATGQVVRAWLDSTDRLMLKLDVDVPPPGAHDVVENLSTAPDVYFEACGCGYNRPRGFLISSAGHVVVDSCRFYNMNQGIQLSGEMKDWYECGCVKDVTIRNCHFDNSAYAGGVAIYCNPMLRCTCNPMLRCTDTIFNGTVVIDNNTFTQATPRMAHIESCQEVVFTNNTFCANVRLPNHPAHGLDGSGVTFANCQNITYQTPNQKTALDLPID